MNQKLLEKNQYFINNKINKNMNISGANPANWNVENKPKAKKSTNCNSKVTKIQLNYNDEITELQTIIDKIEKLRISNPHKCLHDSQISLNLALLSLKQIN